MNIDLYYQLDECLSICRRLSGLLERDRDDFSQCARGELYETYRKNCTIMQEELDKRYGNITAAGDSVSELTLPDMSALSGEQVSGKRRGCCKNHDQSQDESKDLFHRSGPPYKNVTVDRLLVL